MALHPLAAGFADVAGAYERGRPEYPPAVAGAIAAELGVPAGGRVLDLAAGTGKLTRALVGAGLDVVAVEPQAELRELLAAAVGGERVCEGLAEAIPLPDGSVAAVTVADAFHWFDHAAALTEIRRVLRPGGGLAVLSTVPDWTGATWAPEVGTLIAGLRPAHPHHDGPPWRDAVRATGGWSEPREIRLTTMQPARGEQVVDYVASVSWIAALPEDRRAETLAQVDALIAAGETPTDLPVHVVIGLANLIREGHRAIAGPAERAGLDRRSAIARTAGALTGSYPAGCLDRLRDDWPGDQRAVSAVVFKTLLTALTVAVSSASVVPRPATSV